MKKSSAEYQRAYRKRLRELGLIKKEVWVRPENTRQLTAVEKILRQPAESLPQAGMEVDMKSPQCWTTHSLYEALKSLPLFSTEAVIEIIEGTDSSLHITLNEYGDLPVFVTVSGDQLLVEALLWPYEAVKNPAAFNDEILRTHKLFPLSTISLDTLPGGQAYYTMFGALSSTSLLSNIVFEIEVLADNVIKASEAYDHYLETTAA